MSYSKRHKIKCRALTKKGKPCPNNADRDAMFCHIHRADGKFRRQHPRGKDPKINPRYL